MNQIPPHITWPLVIIGFLLLGIGWSIGVVIASRSDGGAEVIDNYYEKAVDWDAEAALRTLSEAQRWKVEIDVQQTDTLALIVSIYDNQGEPARGLIGTITAFRPQKSKPIQQSILKESEAVPGAYSVPFEAPAPGLWDFEIMAKKDTNIVYTTIRKEFTSF